MLIQVFDARLRLFYAAGVFCIEHQIGHGVVSPASRIDAIVDHGEASIDIHKNTQCR
jgi:hypothetical protein